MVQHHRKTAYLAFPCGKIVFVFRIDADVVKAFEWPSYSLSMKIREPRFLESIANNRDALREVAGEFTKASDRKK